MEISEICKRIHRSALSHFERSKVFDTCSHTKQQQQQQQQQQLALVLIQHLLQRQILQHRLRRRQRQERYKRKNQLAILNQVATRLRDIACNSRKSNVRRSVKRKSFYTVDFEPAYLGDSSAVSSLVLAPSQVSSIRAGRNETNITDY